MRPNWIVLPACALGSAAEASVATMIVARVKAKRLRGSVKAAIALLVLFSFEVAATPTWKDATLAMKLGAAALGLAGIAAALAALVAVRRSRHSPAVTA